MYKLSKNAALSSIGDGYIIYYKDVKGDAEEMIGLRANTRGEIEEFDAYGNANLVDWNNVNRRLSYDKPEIKPKLLYRRAIKYRLDRCDGVDHDDYYWYIPSYWYTSKVDFIESQEQDYMQSNILDYGPWETMEEPKEEEK